MLAAVLLAAACRAAGPPAGTPEPGDALTPVPATTEGRPATAQVTLEVPSPAVTPLPTPTQTSQPGGVGIPFRVCQSSPGWQRPSPEELLADLGQRPHYRGGDLTEVVQEALREPLFLDDGSASGMHDVLAAHGLQRENVTESAPDIFGCPDDPPRANTGEDIVVWLMESRLQSIRVAQNTAIFHLEGTGRGYQQIAVPATSLSQALAGAGRARFVGDDGTEVASGRVFCQRSPLSFGPRKGETVTSCFIHDLRIQAPGWPQPAVSAEVFNEILAGRPVLYLGEHGYYLLTAESRRRVAPGHAEGVTCNGHPAVRPQADRLVHVPKHELLAIRDVLAARDTQTVSVPGLNAVEWSPDGSMLAIASLSDGLFVLGPDGELRRIFDLPTRQIRWSPDGSRLLVLQQGYSEPERPRVLVLDLDGQPLAEMPWALPPRLLQFCTLQFQWSADGRYLFQDAALFTAGGRRLDLEPPGQPRGWLPGGELLVVTETTAALDVETGASRLLTGRDIGWDFALSPDGRWLAYAADGWLRKLSVDGSAEEALAPAPQGALPTWTPDGRWVLFSRGSNGLWAASADGGEPMWLAKGLATASWIVTAERSRVERSRHQPTASSEEASLGRLAFVRDCALWVKGLPDGNERRVDEGCSIERPAWSPSGRWLSYRKGDAIWLWNAETNAVRMLMSEGKRPAWGPAEDRIAYTAGQGTVQVTTIPDAHRALTSPQWVDRFGGANRLAWSPDGKRLVVEVTRREDGSEPPGITAQGLYRMRSDRDASSVETAPVYLNPDPVATQSWLEGWSADGEHVLFWEGRFLSASIGADGMPLMAVAASGGEPFRVWGTALPREGFLDWSPDGERLALVVGGGRETWDNQAIAVGSVPGGLRVVSEEGQSDLYPAWSPDGSRIAYTTQPGVPNVPGGSDEQTGMAERRIWVMAPDGSQKHALTYDSDYRDERPEWSRDGQHLLFARIQGVAAELWLMEEDGTEARPVVTGLGLPRPGSTFGFYGHVDWGRLYDWWPGVCRESLGC